MLWMEIGGAGFHLDPAAVSAVRYRQQYGESVVERLRGVQTAVELERLLLRMCHSMIPTGERPPLLEFARLARRDPAFFTHALQARDALLEADPGRSLPPEADGPAEPFNEYKVLALASAAGLDLRLIYELPILHVLSVAEECFRLKDPNQKAYRPMTEAEMGLLYRR